MFPKGGNLIAESQTICHNFNAFNPYKSNFVIPDLIRNLSYSALVLYILPPDTLKLLRNGVSGPVL